MLEKLHGHRVLAMALLCLIAAASAVLSVSACRQGVPVIDPSERPVNAAGTISGTVRGPEGTSPISGRQVEVIDTETGEKQIATTNTAGGFTFKVKPGKYRVEVALLDGESIVKRPGVMHVNQSDVDAHADFVIGSVKQTKPKAPAVRMNGVLRPPIA
jgi:Carboxypeptidase regulatory-like domain